MNNKGFQSPMIYALDNILDLILNFLFIWIALLPSTEKEIVITFLLTFILFRIDRNGKTVSNMLYNMTNNELLKPKSTINLKEKILSFLFLVGTFKLIRPHDLITSIITLSIWIIIVVVVLVYVNKKIDKEI